MQGIVLGDLEDETGELAAEEPVSDLDVAHGALEGTVVEADEVPLAIDELPLVALLGCFAEGETVVRGAQELRVKESDRIAGVVEGLRGLGADIEATEDGFAVRGTRRPARRHDRRARRPPHGDDGRGRRARLAARASRWSGWRPRRSPTRGFVEDLAAALLVAIDGPAGAGKSTVARAVARELGLHLPRQRRDVSLRGAAAAGRARARAGAARARGARSSCGRRRHEAGRCCSTAAT